MVSDDEVPSDGDDRRRGVMHLLAERIAQSASGRAALRDHFWQHASIEVAAARASKGVGGAGDGKGGASSSSSSGKGGTSKAVASKDVESLVGTSAPQHLRPHRVLALNRAENEKSIRVSVAVDKERALRLLCVTVLPPPNRLGSAQRALYAAAAADAYTRLLQASMGRAVRRRLTAEAEEAATRVFATNLRALLLQRPVLATRILGVDPGYKHGCKLAVVSATGAVLASGVMYPHSPQLERAHAKRTLQALVREHGVGVIAIGDGTASQPTIDLVAEAVREAKPALDEVRLSVVSEAGASVLSTSDAAQVSEPTLSPGAIGAASLARRLQDPLSELVRIDPKSVGVGMYQHDLPAAALAAELDIVVQSCVCNVGVDIQTASAALLGRVPGLTAARAAAIVAARPDGGFPSRAALRAVRGIGPKSYEQAAGFLRVPASSIAQSGGEPLDCTAVHPESYAAARVLLAELGHTPAELRSAAGRATIGAAAARALTSVERRVSLAAACAVGERSLTQIGEALNAAERDPRSELPGPLLLSMTLPTLEHLQVGQSLDGVVRNVTSFGCFVNVGLKEDGLLHVSKMKEAMGRGGVTDPLEAACVGQPVRVVVLSVDVLRRRVSLGLDSSRQQLQGGGGSKSKWSVHDAPPPPCKRRK